MTPGPDIAYFSWHAQKPSTADDGAAAVFGITTGCVVHTLAAALGLLGAARDVGNGIRDRQVVRSTLPAFVRRWAAPRGAESRTASGRPEASQASCYKRPVDTIARGNPMSGFPVKRC